MGTIFKQKKEDHNDEQKQPRRQQTRLHEKKNDKRKSEHFYFPALGHRPVPENKKVRIFCVGVLMIFVCVHMSRVSLVNSTLGGKSNIQGRTK